VINYGCDNAPFFILGCVRSGTTMLRDILRLHPRLECPEETHFYRWADPFGSPRYEKNYIMMKIFENHRKLDGISNRAFHDAQFGANNRREMSEAYGKLYLASVGNIEGRWFDKTPQNVYGLPLISYQFPESKFVHIHRHPLNVVASLVEGRVMAKHSVKGAINYWIESLILINEYKKNSPHRLHEIPYEKILENPAAEMEKLCNFLSEDFSLINLKDIQVRPEQNKFSKILTDNEVKYVISSCEYFMNLYDYLPVSSRREGL